MEILVIDGQGGRIRAAAHQGDSGPISPGGGDRHRNQQPGHLRHAQGRRVSGSHGRERPLVACRRADVILGPLGIVIADALMGEISPAMAVAVGQARARRILIPLNQCDNLVAGVAELPVARLLESAVGELGKLLPPPAERNSAKPGGCVSIRRVFLPAWPGYPVGPAPAGPPGAGRGRSQECHRSG